MYHVNIKYLTKMCKWVILKVIKYGGDTLYQVGDHIFYPMHGAGKIKAIEEKEIAGETQQYYIINMLIGNLKVMIPKKRISKTNIRPVNDLDAVKEIATMLETREPDKTLSWKKRYNANMDKIKSGKLQACVEVVYGLLRMQKEAKLNSSEKRMLNRAKRFLMSELKLVEGMNKNIMEKFLSRLTENHTSIS